MYQAGLEYCWTKSSTNVDDVAPGIGWAYYGSSIRGDVITGLWRQTRWAREGGETSLFVNVGATPPNQDRGLVPPMGPLACGLQPPEKISDTATEVSWAEVTPALEAAILGHGNVSRPYQPVTVRGTVTPVTPPEKPQADDTASARLARALQLLKS